MWFVGYLGKVASAGSMARSARNFDLALATTKGGGKDVRGAHIYQRAVFLLLFFPLLPPTV